MVNTFIWHKEDSVRTLTSKGHLYNLEDYFNDLREIWDYADEVAPWAKHSIATASLTGLVNTDEDLRDQEVSILRSKILGCVDEKAEPVNWHNVANWFLGQYILGLVPAFLMCLIWERQGRLKFSLRKSPGSALLYLALWPMNFIVRTWIAFSDIDREARLRLQKDSLFGKLSVLEENFLHSLRAKRGSDLETRVLTERSFRMTYLVALIAVMVMRIMPSAAATYKVPQDAKQMIESSHHDPTVVESNDLGAHRDAIFFTWFELPDLFVRRLVWCCDRASCTLIGFGECVEHVPLGWMNRRRFV